MRRWVEADGEEGEGVQFRAEERGLGNSKKKRRFALGSRLRVQGVGLKRARGQGVGLERARGQGAGLKRVRGQGAGQGVGLKRVRV